MPSQEFQYPSISKRNILRGGATIHPDFVKCRETVDTSNKYQWNENPIRANAPSERL